MKTSESIAEISKALAESWGSLENPKHNREVTVRTKTGGSYQFEYTDLGGVLESVRPTLKKNGIMVIQEPYTEATEVGKFICVETMLLHLSGEWFKSNPLKLPALDDVQGVGGQITYLKRYSLSAMLGIASEEDNDGNIADQNDYQHKKEEPKEIGKSVLIAKFKQAGATEEQFAEWYAKQTAAGFNHNQMDQYLTKALMERANKNV